MLHLFFAIKNPTQEHLSRADLIFYTLTGLQLVSSSGNSMALVIHIEPNLLVTR